MKAVFRNWNRLSLFTLTLLVITSIASLGMSGFGGLASSGSTLLDGPAGSLIATTRVSVSSTGTQGNDFSSKPSISSNGRYVAFMSDASNLVGGDTNGMWDVFVHDMQTSTTRRVSVDSFGNQGYGSSSGASISGDGRYVAFMSWADNLVKGDTNSVYDIFVRDRLIGTTTRISISSGGTQGNGHSLYPSISANGRFVGFQSFASNLVRGDTNGVYDIFVHDRMTGMTTRASISSSGTQGNAGSLEELVSISADGRYVAFESTATNLVSGDTNGMKDIFVRDRKLGVTTRVSVAPDGSQMNYYSERPSISANGRYVAFETNYIYKIFIYDGKTGKTEGLSLPSGMTGESLPSISADGRYVAFGSSYSATPQYVFIHDRQTVITSLVSINSSRIPGNDYSNYASISADGRHVAFESSATNLVSGDTNSELDVFVHDRGSSVAPKPLSPSGPTGDKTPTYKWSTVGWYTKYKLAVYSLKTSSYVVLQDVPASKCSATTCSFTPSTPLGEGTYKFRVRGYSSAGWGPWSVFLTFKVSRPEAPTLISPSGTIGDSTPTYKWNRVATATKYKLYVYSVGAGALILEKEVVSGACSGGVCKYTSPTPLSMGDYRFKVRAYNSLGWGPSSSWMKFRYGRPAAPTTLAPKGFTSDTTPTYKWIPSGGALRYKLLVYSHKTSSVVLTANLHYSGICSAKVCSYTPKTALSAGKYHFSLRAYNKAGWGPVSKWTIFELVVSPPGAPTLISPSGTTGDSTPTYKWNKVATASTYRLTVKTSTGTLVLSQVVNVSTACSGSVCAYTSSTPLSLGNYRFKVSAKNVVGGGPASAWMNFNLGWRGTLPADCILTLHQQPGDQPDPAPQRGLLWCGLLVHFWTRLEPWGLPLQGETPQQRRLGTHERLDGVYRVTLRVSPLECNPHGAAVRMLTG
jgi:Tol biopolymer transport system component